MTGVLESQALSMYPSRIFIFKGKTSSPFSIFLVVHVSDTMATTLKNALYLLPYITIISMFRTLDVKNMMELVIRVVSGMDYKF